MTARMRQGATARPAAGPAAGGPAAGGPDTGRPAIGGDGGAVLVVVLLLVTAIALVTGAVLTQVDTSVRATVAMRDQAGASYNGDAAAQVAINQLRRSTYNNAAGSNCFGGSGTLALPGFYPGTNGQSGAAASSAAVTCVAEAGTGSQGGLVPVTSANKPGNAVLTLGTSAAETGQTYGQSQKPVTIHGSVVSNSTIDSTNAVLTVTGGVQVFAVGACTGPISPACSTLGAPVADPNYPAPTDPPAPPASLPACTSTSAVAEFRPGLYTTADTFNNCKASWLLFDPGTYYFDFTAGSHVWTVNGTMVAGTVPGITPGAAPAAAAVPTVPGACVNPISSPSAVGVQFVFGGDSQLVFAKNSLAEVCASYHATSIPTALYGLKSNIVNGAYTAHAQSGCITLAGGCKLVSDGTNGTKPTFFFEGFVYAPRASIDIAVNNTAQPYFNFGVVLRTLTLTTTASASTAAFISLPDNSPGYGTAATMLDLSVYVCPGVTTSTCATDAGRQLQLTARVQLRDPTGSPVAGAREVTILSWSGPR
jgi:Tfp pilus assembly protein PilX